MVTKRDETIYVQEVRTETLDLVLAGTTPLILNRMSEKAKRQLLWPDGRKTTAEKQSSLKHAPLDEYRASAYTLAEGPTLLGVMCSAIKGATMTAALDLPGTKKAQIGRLVYVLHDYAPVYGIPKLLMSVTRSADINRTPDIRTRAIVPEWVVCVTIRYVVPLLNATSIANLVAAAGITVGIGDWRSEKGKGNYGQFRIGGLDDPKVRTIMAEGGREAQQAALDKPDCYDDDSARLLSWYSDKVRERGK